MTVLAIVACEQAPLSAPALAHEAATAAAAAISAAAAADPVGKQSSADAGTASASSRQARTHFGPRWRVAASDLLLRYRWLHAFVASGLYNNGFAALCIAVP